MPSKRKNILQETSIKVEAIQHRLFRFDALRNFEYVGEIDGLSYLGTVNKLELG